MTMPEQLPAFLPSREAVRHPAPSRAVDGEHDIPARLHAELRARIGIGDREGAIDYAARLRTHLDGLAPSAEAPRTVRFLLSLAAEGLMYEGVLRSLGDLYSAAARAASVDEQQLKNHALERIALIHASQGRLRQAGLVLFQAEGQPGNADANPFLAGVNALIAVERLDSMAGRLIWSAYLDEIPDPYWSMVLLGRARWEMSHGGAAAVLDLVAIARTAKRIRRGSLAESTLFAIRATALTAMGDPVTAAGELADDSAYVTPELELARSRAAVYLGASSRTLALNRCLAASEEAGPSTRAEAMLLALQSDPLDVGTADRSVHAVRALVELEGIRRVMTTATAETVRRVWPEESLSVTMPEPPVRPRPLRDSEQRVLAALADAGDMNEIAERLHISKNTLKTHVRAIYKKLGVSARHEAVARSYRHGLLAAEHAGHGIGT